MDVDLRRPWPFALFVLLSHVLARFLGVGAHEILGHAAAAVLLGGSAYGVYVSPGSGIAYVYLPRGLPVEGAIAMLAAGIAVEVALGAALWWTTRRSPSFGVRAFGLVGTTVFVVYGLLYMAAGAFESFPGDTWRIVTTLQAPPLAYGIAAVGILWTVLVAVLVSFDVLRLFGGPGRDLKRELLLLALFWLVPAPLAFLPGFSGFNALGPSPVAYVAAFAGVLCAVAGLLLTLDFLPTARGPPPAPGASWRPIAAAAVPLLLLVPVWVGVFGATPGTAHGLLLGTPPVEAEPAWLGELAVNLEVVVHGDLTVTLYWRFHGTLTPASPLEARIADSFRDRMDREFYEGVALSTVGGALNESGWAVEESSIHPGEAVWAAGQSYAGARVVRLGPSPGNGLRFLSPAGPNLTVLTVHDPFKFGTVAPSGGWLDALKVRWEPPLLPERYGDSGGTTPRLVSADYVQWQNFNRPSAHTTYQVTLRSP
jgi:hypothetical protein